MLKRFLYLFLILLMTSSCLEANVLYNRDSLVKVLDRTLESKEYFIVQKNQKIDFFKQMLNNSPLSLDQEYILNSKLFDEYEKFQSDSALIYLNKNKLIALKLEDDKLLLETNIKIASVYSTVGLFVEAKSILDSLILKGLDDSLLSKYYEAYIYYYDRYGQNNQNLIYIQESEQYRDSLIASFTDVNLLRNKILYAEYAYQKDDLEKAQADLITLLKQTIDTDKERAMIAYLLGNMYAEEGNIRMQEQYYLISAISDVTNAIRDNASLQSLALTYYQKGDIDRAYKFIDYAIDDALLCNVKYRALGGLSFYPLINSAYQAKEAEQKEKLKWSLVFITLLVLFLVVSLIYVYKQMKHVTKMREELFATNTRLVDLNQEMVSANLQLQDSNDKLLEVSHVKEEYITQFFDLCSEYIEKIESYRVSLNKLAVSKKLDELFKRLKSTSFVDDELENLYNRFDVIFMTLYPSFIEDFNTLLREEEQIVLKPNELLNTELRIFALIRLGITDSGKIAKFLRYSLSTIYNYRTSARNKAVVSRNEFEEKIMSIGIIKK